MTGLPLLVAGAVFVGVWLLYVAGFRLRVPVEAVARGRSRAAWQMVPLGFGCLLVALVVVPWEAVGSGPGEASGSYVGGAVGLASLLMSRIWPERLFPHPSWHLWMRRIFLSIGVLVALLIIASPLLQE